MKLFILLFFVSTAPVVIFLSTILFASDMNTILKTNLAKNAVYDKLTEKIVNLASDDSDSQALTYFIKQKFTTDYVKEKAESAIDSSSDWITGKTETKPVVSFKDIKEEILAQNPGLLTSIQEMADEMKNQAAQDGASDPEMQQQNAEMQKSMNSLTDIAKSDFTIKLDPYLIGLKNFYDMLRILVPVLAVVLVLCLVLLYKLCQSFISRMKWIAATVTISGLMGIGIIVSNSYLVDLLKSVLGTNSNGIVTVVSPIALEFINYFVNKYLLYQGIISGIFLAGAFACLVIAGLHNDSAPAVQKVSQKANSKPKGVKKK